MPVLAPTALEPLPPPVALTAEQGRPAPDRQEEARALLNTGALEQAVLAAEQRVADAPRCDLCYRTLGAAAASLAARDQSSVEMQRAADAYRRYLETAPPDEAYVRKVRAILEPPN